MVSIITAVAPSHIHLLGAGLASLERQDLDWEWLIQIDGPMPSGGLPRHRRVKVVANGIHRGVSITRNRALLRASGSCVFSLDADDELAPGALPMLLKALAANPAAAFAIGETLDLFPDGTCIRRFALRPYTEGPLPRGRLEDVWRSRKNLFIQPSGVLYRRNAVVAAGGWPAITGMEDQDLLFAVSSQASGVYLPATVYLYRQHPDQTVRSPAFLREREDARAWCDARLRAQHAQRGEDQAVLEALRTPLPTPKEVDGFMTPQWRTATALHFGGE